MRFILGNTAIVFILFISCFSNETLETITKSKFRSKIDSYLLKKNFIHDSSNDLKISPNEAFTTFIPFYKFPEWDQNGGTWHDNWRMQARNQPHESMIAISLAMLGQCTQAEKILATFFRRISPNGAIEYHAMRENNQFSDSPGMVGAPFLAWTTLKVAEICDNTIVNQALGPLERNWQWWNNGGGGRRFNGGDCAGLWHWNNVYEAIRDSNQQAGHPNLPTWFSKDGSLIVQDVCPPDLNFFLLGNLRSIIELKKKIGAPLGNLQNEADGLAGLIRDKLWDENQQFFFTKKNNGEFLPVKDIGGWMALLGFGATVDQANKMVSRYLNCQQPKADDFCTPIGLPSLAKNEPGYGPNEHWLGGVWPAYTLMTVAGLKNYGFDTQAKRIATSFSKVVSEGLKNNLPLPEWYDNQVGIRRENLFCIEQVQNKEQQKWVNCNYITSALALPMVQYAQVNIDIDERSPGQPCKSAGYITCLKQAWGKNKTLVCGAEQKILACDKCTDGKIYDPNIAVDSRGYYHDYVEGCN